MAEEQVKNRLEQDSIGKLMLELCTQTTLSIMIYNIYTITDTFYVSTPSSFVPHSGDAKKVSHNSSPSYPAGWAREIRLVEKK